MSFIVCSSSDDTAAGLDVVESDYWESIQYSPSGVHAIILVYGVGGEELGNSLIFVNLLNRKNSDIIGKPEWKSLLHAYWLSNDLISVFIEKENGHFTHFVYKINMEEIMVQLELIQETDIPYGNGDGGPDAFGLTFQDPCKLKLNGHDFLFVKSYKFMLTPFNPLNGPSLPCLSFDITDFVHGLLFRYNKAVCTQIQCMFACHNNSVFMYISTRKKTLFDQFLKIDIVDFNLISKKVRAKDGHLDVDNVNLVRMNRKCKGKFSFSHFPMIWQNEEFAVAYERDDWPRKTKSRRVIVVNLEKETVMEKVVKFKFTQVTLYRGFLLFWIVPDSAGKISFKFEWIGEKMPSLRDICTVKMLSQRVESSRFKKLYKNMTKYLY